MPCKNAVEDVYYLSVGGIYYEPLNFKKLAVEETCSY